MESFINDYVNDNKCFEFVNLKNLDDFLKKTKSTISNGEDEISNILLKNMSKKFKLVFIHLFRTILKTMIIPDRWKKVIVRMIPKKEDNKKDPKNYRPISITSCISRLGERFILLEITKHLKENHIILNNNRGLGHIVKQKTTF
jgi:hypothetical protein